LSSFDLAVLISGSGTNLQAIIDAVASGDIPNAKVALVISNREGAYGLERAKKHGIPNIVVDNNDAERLLSILESHAIKGIVLAGYLEILSPDVVAGYDRKIINIHPALLPMFGGKGFYGIKVHSAVLASGVTYTGATAHIVDNGVDTGTVLVRGVVPIKVEDTAESLQKRVLEIEHKVLVQAVKALAENKIEDLSGKPGAIINEADRKSVRAFARALMELGGALGGALTEAGNGET